jgi:hypothetical protein
VATKTVSPTEDAVVQLTELAESADESRTNLTQYLEQALGAQKKIALAAIDSYQESVLRIVDSYENVVADTELKWLKDLVAPQAAAVREVTTLYTDAAQQLVG